MLNIEQAKKACCAHIKLHTAEFSSSKLGFPSPYIFATQWSRPILTNNSVQIFLGWNIKGLHHQVAKIQGLENLRLKQSFKSFINWNKLNILTNANIIDEIYVK